ncbi:hypothetical protein AXXA_06273 [Achromobacter insuavis AXX-A]|uniref:Uncharacterized protein n=1 Tax=Achromobacter insuavis AXX-A TaxID=1003200 RepID=F7SWZ9_9BURK|nr:hypothetical protein AXXA_06273 [Achromobacter insuavis AXX-A]
MLTVKASVRARDSSLKVATPVCRLVVTWKVALASPRVVAWGVAQPTALPAPQAKGPRTDAPIEVCRPLHRGLELSWWSEEGCSAVLHEEKLSCCSAPTSEKLSVAPHDCALAPVHGIKARTSSVASNHGRDDGGRKRIMAD